VSNRFVILTWHSIRVHDNTREGNDLVALSEDLALIDREAWTILPLGEALGGLRSGNLPDKCVVLTFDDGSVMDFHDFEHPSCGRQTSVINRLRAFANAPGTSPRHRIHASTFVIASPEARAEMDRAVTMNLGVWPEDWWRDANHEGLMSVESHSWDHNHDSLEKTAQRDNHRGDFSLIDTPAECRAEIDRASDYIELKSGRRPRFLAYPYGNFSTFLAEEYLPAHAERIGLEAAVTCTPEPVTTNSDRWRLPRYVCSQDWKTSDELRRLLSDAAGR